MRTRPRIKEFMAIASQQLSQQEIKERRIASLVSLIVSVILLSIKFWAYDLTNSKAIFSDAMESIVNVIAAALALAVVQYAAKPKDEDHPYGHGKAEYFSAAFEGGLITFAGLFILIDASRALYLGRPLNDLDFGMYLILGAGVGNLLLGLYLDALGKKRGSVALQASAKHVLSDFYTSVGVIIGLILVQWTGFERLDAITAIIVGALLSRSGVKLVRESAGGLMDREDLSALETLAKVFNENVWHGVIQIHHVKIIRAGWYHHIDAHIVLPEFWTISEVHDNINRFEKKVIDSYPFGGEMNFHFDPCGKAYCEVCDLPDCPIRVKAFKQRKTVEIAELRALEEPEQFRRHRH